MNTACTDPDPKLRRWDQLGVWVSTLCAIHCLIAPLVFLALPAFSGIWEHPASHALIAVLVLPLAAVVLVRGYRLHRKRWIAAAAVVGMVCILVGCALPLVGGVENLANLSGTEGLAGPNALAGGEVAGQADACASCCPQVVVDEDGNTGIGWPAASIVTIVGSMLLAAGHFGNIISRRCC